jgi:streptogramin lyase
MALDSTGRVWMAWGKSLVEYDPDARSSHTYALPGFARLGVQVHLYQDGLDGNLVALAIDSTGEIWVAAYKVAGVFGFNPARGSWDRTVRLPWFLNDGTRLAAPQPGMLTVNGFRSPDGKVFKTMFAKVEASTGHVIQLPAQVLDYVVTDRDAVVYVDDAGNIAKLSLLDGSSTVIASKAPLGGMSGATLATDGKGHLWFSLLAYRSVGVAMLDLTSGSITNFPFPYIKDPGQKLSGTPSPLNMPCPAAGACITSADVFDAGVQAIVPDQRDHIWVITELPGSGDPNDRGPMAPIVELQPNP